MSCAIATLALHHLHGFDRSRAVEATALVPLPTWSTVTSGLEEEQARTAHFTAGRADGMRSLDWDHERRVVAFYPEAWILEPERFAGHFGDVLVCTYSREGWAPEALGAVEVITAPEGSGLVVLDEVGDLEELARRDYLVEVYQTTTGAEVPPGAR